MKKQVEGWLYMCETYDCSDLLLFNRQLTMEDIIKHADEQKKDIELAYGGEWESLKAEELQELQEDLKKQEKKLKDGVLVCNCLTPCRISGAVSLNALFLGFKGKKIRITIEELDDKK